MQRILLVYDVDGWAWHQMALGIQRYAPKGFQVVIGSHKKWHKRYRQLSKFDAVLWFSWTECPLEVINYCQRLWTTIDHHGGMYDYDPNAKWTPDVAATEVRCLNRARERFPQFTGVIAKNPVLFEFMKELNAQTVYLPAGVDTQFWQPSEISTSGPLKVAWCGQKDVSNPWHSTKGYQQVFLPLKERLQKQQANIVFQTNTANHRKGNLSPQEMVKWYQQADAFLCTSSTEGGPLPVFEAAACGRPVISTSVGSVPEMLVDGQNGYLLKTFTNEQEANLVVELAEKYLLSLESDRQQLSEMSAQIRTRMESKFCWRQLSNQWLNALIAIPAQTHLKRANSFLRIPNLFVSNSKKKDAA